MDNLTFSKIKESIDKYQSIAIVTPQDPTVDEMGAALSLYLALRDSGKSLAIATPRPPLVEVSSLVGINDVKTSLGGADGDLVVSFPYREGEIEKVSYTRDDNFLNIVVKAGELGLGFDEKDIKYTRGGTAPELLFVVGAARVSDLGPLFDPSVLKNTIVINIDNKADNQGFGDIVMVSQRLSSVSEAIASLIVSLSLKLDLDIAQNLMLGIATATNNFQSEQTSPLAFEMAGSLLRAGALRPQNQAPRRKLNMNFEEKEEKPYVSAEAPIQPVNQEEPKQEIKTPENPPEDWLEPKIYKGSTNF
jgi:hypothetical protein